MIQYKIDTGAQANVLPLSTLRQISTVPTLEKTDTRLSAYNGSDIPIIGKTKLTINHCNQSQCFICSCRHTVSSTTWTPDYHLESIV